jgi:hypothetical protein
MPEHDLTPTRSWWPLLLPASLAACSLTQRPPVTEVAQPAPPLPASDMSVGAKVSLAGLANQLNTLVPSQFHDRSSDVKWAYFKYPCGLFKWCKGKTKVCAWDTEVWVNRTPFLVRPAPGGVSVSSTFTIRGRVYGKSPCPSFRETTDPDGVTTLTVSIRPSMNGFYAVEPGIAANPFKWDRKPGIKLADYINLSLGTVSAKAAQKLIDRAVKEANAELRQKLDFQDKVRTAWAELHQPIALTADGTGWLSIKPLSLHATPVISDTQYARIFVGMRSKNEAVFGAKPAAHDEVRCHPAAGEGRRQVHPHRFGEARICCGARTGETGLGGQNPANELGTDEGP